MKVVILYRQKSEHARLVETFIHDFQKRYNAGSLEVLDADSQEGVATAELYDIVSYPAIIALRDDGSVLKSWSDEMLPLMDEVAYYVTSLG